MKKIYELGFLALFLAFNFSVVAQDDCAKDISTNPDQPFNNHPFPSNRYNPWINSDFDIGELDGSSVPPMPLNNQIAWQISDFVFGNTFEMINPYRSAGTPNNRYNYLHPDTLDFEYRDYQWEDGWEVLHIGLGYYPNGEPIQNAVPERAYSSASNVPSNPRVPYIILYNRYRGVMRVFMNLFTTFGGYSDIWIRLQFEDESPSGLSGVLRPLEAFDRPLDQTTNVIQQESYNPNAGGTNRWFSADFQLAYDPCICGKNQEWKFTLNGVETFTLDLVGRGLAVDVPIADSEGNPTYDGDWLDMNGREDGLEGGYQIFDKMEGLVEDYKDALDKYEQDAALYADYLEKKVILDAFKGFIVDGTTGLVAGPLKSFLKPKEGSTLSYEAYIKGASKGLLGYGYNHLSMAINPKKSAPKAPDMPVASYSEMRYTGEITGTSQDEVIGPFFIPGSYDESSALSNLDAFNYPAYNAPVGLSAMLSVPEPLIYFEPQPVSTTVNQNYQPLDCERKETWTSEASLDMRFDEKIEVALNNSLDFDTERTGTYVMLEITLSDGLPGTFNARVDDDYDIEQLGGNLVLESEIRALNQRFYLYKSEWVLLEDLNQMLFSLDVRKQVDITKLGILDFENGVYECSVSYVASDNPNFNSEFMELSLDQITLKVAHDYYFDQIGTNGDQVNTFQVFSYELYNKGAGINYLADESTWGTATADFDAYITGDVFLDSEVIDPNHQAVTSVMFNGGLVIDAQRVVITDGLNIANGYTLTINALEEIKIEPGVQLSPSGAVDPRIHLNIKNDFYNTPVFEYVDDASSFCGENGDYQSNVASIRINEDNENQEVPDEILPSQKARGSIQLFPNPARNLLTLRSSHLDMSSITIHDLSGRPIKQETLQAHSRETQINLAGIAPGTYIVRVDCGDEVFSEKLVVTR